MPSEYAKKKAKAKKEAAKVKGGKKPSSTSGGEANGATSPAQNGAGSSAATVKEVKGATQESNGVPSTYEGEEIERERHFVRYSIP